MNETNLKRLRQYRKAIQTMRKSRELVAKTDCQGDITLEQVTKEIVERIDINIMVLERRSSMISREMMHSEMASL